ncbi:conserved hypothetical protein [Burkholderia cenocepacia]|nr:conserved hypothetical protein [Burkholderia cenocepacia]
MNACAARAAAHGTGIRQYRSRPLARSHQGEVFNVFVV